MIQEEYIKAVQQLQETKIKSNYVVLEFGYGSKFVLPHKDAVVILGALSSIEQLDESYGNPSRITPVDRSKISITMMSAEEYRLVKIANLLGISIDTLKEHENTNKT